MEATDFLDLRYGVAGLCVLCTLFILMKVAEFVWNIREKKDSNTEIAMEKLTMAVQENTLSNGKIELEVQKMKETLSQLPKLQKDLMRYFSAVKIISGDKWPEVRKQIMEGDL